VFMLQDLTGFGPDDYVSADSKIRRLRVKLNAFEL